MLVNFQTYFSDQEIEVQLGQTGFVLFFSVCFVFSSENCPCAFGFAILVAQETPLKLSPYFWAVGKENFWSYNLVPLVQGYFM